MTITAEVMLLALAACGITVTVHEWVCERRETRWYNRRVRARLRALSSRRRS